ncbi:MAG: HdeD family acid-resistance protein [Candidatus Scatomorpha sp.]|jgi:uncharacterized membrane protein HdeD (DUF308 family)
MNSFKEKAGGLLTAVCEAVIGVLLLINPVGFTTSIITVLGVLLIITGIVQIISYFRVSPEDGAKGQGMTKGLLEVLAGLFCALDPEWFVAVFPVLTILYGLGCLILGAAKLQSTVDMARLRNRRWAWSAVSTLVTLVCAAVILFNPFATTAMLWTFLAVSLIVEAVLDVLAICISGRKPGGDETAA